MKVREDIDFIINIDEGGLRRLALMIGDRLRRRIEEILVDGGNIDDIYGIFGMAVMFEAYGNGRISDERMYSFLGRLALRKTVDPVQGIDVVGRLDMGRIVSELMDRNADALREMEGTGSGE